MNRLKALIIVLLVMPVLNGCGGSGASDEALLADGEPGALVTAMALTAEDNLETDISVDFSYGITAVINEGRSAVLVLRLPSALMFSRATLSGNPSGEPLFPIIEVCDDGTSFIEFSLEAAQLEGSFNPPGDGDARLLATLVSTGEGNNFAILSARARLERVSYSCDTFFDLQAELTLPSALSGNL